LKTNREIARNMECREESLLGTPMADWEQGVIVLARWTQVIWLGKNHPGLPTMKSEIAWSVQ
jgi:hypothetical protein